MCSSRSGRVLAAGLAAALVLLGPTGARPQPAAPADADNVVPVAASVQVLRNVELAIGGSRVRVSSLEYAQQGTAVYLLPVWVVAGVEALGPTGRWEELAPESPLPATAVRLRVRLANLLAQEDARTAVEQRLRDHVARAEGSRPEQVRLRAPTFNPRGYRAALAAPSPAGDGGEALLTQSAVVPAAVAEDSGPVVLDLRPEAVAALRAATAEPALLRDAYLKVVGQMRARFEKQQYLANFHAVQTAVTSLQNDLRSNQPAGQPAPEVFVQVPLGGAVEGRATVAAAFSQYLVGTISVREGAAVNPGLLGELAERVLGRVLAPLELAQADDGRRVAVMLGNAATVSATVGEIKGLAKATRGEREQRLRDAMDEMEAQRAGRQSEYRGALGVRFPGGGGKLEAGYATATADERAARRKRETETLHRGLDELARHFDGRLPTLTGIRFDQKALDESVKAVQVEVQQSSFTTGWSQHDWAGVKLAAVAPAVSPELLARQLAAARARYADFERLLAAPKRLEALEAAEARVRELERTLQEERRLNAARAAEWEKRLRAYREVPMWLAVERATLAPANHRPGYRTVGAAFSPDGKRVVGGQWRGANAESRVQVWDVATGAEVAGIRGDTWASAKAVLSPDGKTLAGGCKGGVRLWDAGTGREVATLPLVGLEPDVVRFSPDGKLLAVGGGRRVFLLDVPARTQTVNLTAETANFAIHDLAFSPDGRTLAIGGTTVVNGIPGHRDGKIVLWDLATGKVTHTFSSSAKSLVFSPDGKSLISCFWREVTMWDVAGRHRICDLHRPHENGNYYSLAVSPDGRTLAAGGEFSVELWDLQSRTVRAVIPASASDPHLLDFSPDGKSLVVGTDDGAIKIWDIQTYHLFGRPGP